MKRTNVLTLAAVSALVLSSGCGVTSPDMSLEFPFYLLQDISTPIVPVSCCYLKSGDDGLAGADSLYFVDYQDGYCLAVVGVQGYTIEDVGATAEGGYGLALCGNLLFYVSDGTYQVHSPVALNSYGRFILTQPQGGSWHLYSVGADGSVTTVNSQSWDVVSVDSVTGLEDPVAAVITADGQHIFIADGSDDMVKKVSVGDLTSVVAECHVPGGISDMYAGTGNLVYVAPDSLSEIWGIDTGTGQHYSTYQIQNSAVSVAVTPDDHYIYAGYQGNGISVVNAENGEEEVFASSYGTITDIAVNGSGSRAMLCSNLDKILSWRNDPCMSMPHLRAANVVNFALAAQGLGGSCNSSSPASAVHGIINRLGYVQIDTISVVRRAHHHALWNRCRRDYRARILHRLQAEDRKVFEYWGHAASYLPMEDYRFYIPRMKRYFDPKDKWVRKRHETYGHLMDGVLERIRNEGPLGSRDFKSEKRMGNSVWGNWKPAKIVLELLFWRGELMVTRRDNFNRIYDLTERVLPSVVDTSVPDDRELGRFLVRRALRAHGAAVPRTITDNIRTAGRDS